MRVGVVGAGIIGVTTAYELAAQGHAVVVFERRASVASETSFANAGVVAPGYVTPWAAPGMPAKVLRQLLRRDASVRLALPMAPGQQRWMWRCWRACRARCLPPSASACTGWRVKASSGCAPLHTSCNWAMRGPTAT